MKTGDILTNQEHWTAAKEQVAKKYDYRDFDYFWKADDHPQLDEAFTEAAELMAQNIREEYENKIPYRCKCNGNLDGCGNETCWDLKECQDIYIQSSKKDKEIERLKGIIDSLTKVDPAAKEKEAREIKTWEDFREGAYNAWKKKNPDQIL